MRAGGPAVCVGDVHHRRSVPAAHSFTGRVRYVWIDPDRPCDLTDRHWAWSSDRPAPVRFRRSDYGRPGLGTLADHVREDLAPVLGDRPTGDVRMLTQLRHLGWLFNPITVFLAWDDDPDRPVGAILEVTNTPWKERHRYPVALTRVEGRYVAHFAKVLHVSPFLDEDFVYDLSIEDRDDRIVIDLDVIPDIADEAATPAATVSTRLDVARTAADRDTLGAALRAVPLSTHRVSAGIHIQALRLWRKRVPFVSHPAKRNQTDSTPETDQVDQVHPPIHHRHPTEATR